MLSHLYRKSLTLYLVCICFQHFVIMVPSMAANATWPQGGKDEGFPKDETLHSILEGNKAELQRFALRL